MEKALERQREGEVKGGTGREQRVTAFKAELGHQDPREQGPGKQNCGPHQARWGQDGKKEAGQALVDTLEFGKGRACREEENRVGKESIKLTPKPAPGLQALSW